MDIKKVINLRVKHEVRLDDDTLIMIVTWILVMLKLLDKTQISWWIVLAPFLGGLTWAILKEVVDKEFEWTFWKMDK